MELLKITENVYYFHAAVNIGYIRFSNDAGMLIDAGLEDQAMKIVVRKLEEMNLPLSHLFITHAHADHYGGAAYLQRERDIYTFAPHFESAILQNPMLEPLYLFHGAHPLEEWRSKFLEGKPMRVDRVVSEEKTFEINGGGSFQTISLPGHSYFQYGVVVENILFAADAYFGADILHKHKIPFIVDANQTFSSLRKIKNLSCKGAVPGHGRYEEAFIHTIEENIAVHQQVEEMLVGFIQEQKQGITIETLVTMGCTELGITIKNAPSFMLFRTAITAYLTKLMQENVIEFHLYQNQLLVRSSCE
ncbi:Hydroxyacylglutathione hydrolase [Bacillus sp. THAF10]|uniref:MBL fold metallo-hydrolase n=1 Tax=Bacillus sp. THAF10 TaxID=2587848 RepID=UPI0012678CFD|nr:MBL fold metallo-hydrolase [Bacillus sp. THAF10]QFT88443.1 Hydroxyacylglutathione hydrolase [Bacillus sp. THAF10]